MHVTTLLPGLESHDSHTHKAEEIILIIEGNTGMLIRNGQYKADAGDLYYLGSNVLHGIKNIGTVPTTYFAYQWEYKRLQFLVIKILTELKSQSFPRSSHVLSEMKSNFYILVLFLFPLISIGQKDSIDKELRTVVQGQVVKLMINGTDTLFIADLQDVHISSPRTFKDYDEYRLYMRYKRYAADVYPYAKQAIDVYRKIREETEDLSRHKKRKFVKTLNKENEYTQDYKETFKNMTRTQGKVLIKMIERELDVPFYDLIKDVKGGFTAMYWSTLSGFYGYHLKEKYQKGEDPILDAVLQDFNITQRLK